MKRVVFVVNEFGMDGGGLSLSACQMKSMLESDYGFEVLLVDSSLWTKNECFSHFLYKSQPKNLHISKICCIFAASLKKWRCSFRRL